MLIPINEIRVGKRLRALHELTVDQLVESIQKLGLQVPVSVVTGQEKDADGVSFELVAGHHRLQACRCLGWHEIEAQIVHLNDNQRELWEIDENLCRAELSELERAEHLAKRKEVYERLHPETRAASGAELAQKRWGYATDNLSAASSFAADTAEKIGTTARDIRRSIHRATKIDPAVRDRIRDKPEIADSGVELDALASLKPRQQGDAVSLVESGRAADIRDAKRLIEPTPPQPEPQIGVLRQHRAKAEHGSKADMSRAAVLSPAGPPCSTAREDGYGDPVSLLKQKWRKLTFGQKHEFMNWARTCLEGEADLQANPRERAEASIEVSEPPKSVATCKISSGCRYSRCRVTGHCLHTRSATELLRSRESSAPNSGASVAF